MKYELVSGFETHIELSTKTKIFCGCTTQFGGEPNTHCCPVCIGLPGTLPVLNREVVRYAIKAGLAVHGKIAEIAKMDRKNYCYPDLAKAYQISQLYAPLIIGGYIELSNGRRIRLHHIHIEEDAGKLIHRHGDTYVDYNRGGVPLIEIVSEPDIRSIDEAKEYVERLQQVMRWVGISDCKMQEGSMRCDVNISVRPQGSEAFGTRTEIKNMNSITNIARAMEYEYDRQVDLLESGGKVVQETLRFDDATGTTSSMRSKEDAHDYRYFRDPDLVTINVPRYEVEQLRAEMPELPDEKLERYTDDYGIPEKDAALLTKYRNISEYFDKAIEGVKSPKTVSNFIIGQIFRGSRPRPTRRSLPWRPRRRSSTSWSSCSTAARSATTSPSPRSKKCSTPASPPPTLSARATWAVSTTTRCWSCAKTPSPATPRRWRTSKTARQRRSKPLSAT